MLGNNISVDTAAHIELGGDAHESWITGSDEVTQHLIGDCLVECTFIAERPDVHLQCLQLDAATFRNVVDIDSREIWLAGFGAEASEFRNTDVDGVVAPLIGIFKGLECFTWCAGHRLHVGAFVLGQIFKVNLTN